ncbi:MAG: phage holin family protein [Bacteroidota bacterium]
MKKLISKLLISTIAIIIAVWILPGVTIYGLGHTLNTITVTGIKYAFYLALLLSVLNVTVKPILKLLSLPFTIVTLGLFLLVINAIVVLIADWFMDSVKIDGFLWAMIFSVLITIVNWFLVKFFGLNEKENKKTKLLDQYGNEIQ